MKVWSFILDPVAQRETVAESLQESREDYVSQRRDEDKKGIRKAPRLEGGAIQISHLCLNMKPHFIHFILAKPVKAQNTLYQFLTVKSCFDNLTSMMISGFGAIISSPWWVCLRRNPLGLRGVFTELREIQRSAHGSWNVQLLWQSWPPQPDVLNSINDSLYSSLFSASLLPSAHEFHTAVVTVDSLPPRFKIVCTAGAKRVLWLALHHPDYWMIVLDWDILFGINKAWHQYQVAMSSRVEWGTISLRVSFY